MKIHCNVNGTCTIGTFHGCTIYAIHMSMSVVEGQICWRHDVLVCSFDCLCSV